MLTLQGLIGALPSARLAEADLPRFLTQALGRLSTEDLSVAQSLLEEEQLVGYPRALGPLMRGIIDSILNQGLSVGTFEPADFDRLMAAPEFLAMLDGAFGLEHQVLRPGEIVSAEMRDIVGHHLRVLPGVGAHLTLVSPVEVTRLPGLGHAVVRSSVLARPMSSEEAEAFQVAWATIEETSGWPGPDAREWEARFVRVASRPNFSASETLKVLSAMLPPRRCAIWDALVEHLRHQELPETHRPGAVGLARRLESLSLKPEEEAGIEGLMELARAAYRACRHHPGAQDGDYPLVVGDVATYVAWVEHPQGVERALMARSPEEVQRLLRLITAHEQGRLQITVDPDEARWLRMFRDQYLAAVYRRDTRSLCGVDPLLLAQAHVAAGEDKEAILDRLHELALDARTQRELALEAACDNPAPEPEEMSAPVPDEAATSNPFSELAPRIPKRPTTSPGINPFAASEEDDAPHRIPTATPPMKLPPLPQVPPARPRRRTSSSMSLPPLPDKPLRSRASRPRTRPRTQPFPDFESMPLPIPAAAKTQESKEPAPSQDLDRVEAELETAATEASHESPPAETSAQAELDFALEEGENASLELSVEPSAEEPQEEIERESEQGNDEEVEGAVPAVSTPAEVPQDTLPPLPTPRTEPSQTTSGRVSGRLVTPGQAARFYSEAFRELQVLERDLLERGAWPKARRRVQALGDEARELSIALGPPARSGDMDFQGALKKVELVLSYLDRIAPLLSETRPAPAEPDPAGVLDRLSGMFKRPDDEA